MVYCVKCGTKNPDDAKVCSQCGAPLYLTGEGEQYRRVESGCYGPRRSGEPYRRVEDECFGIPHGGMIVGIVIGLIIILVGLNLFLKTLYPTMPDIPWWAFLIILVGALMIVGAIYGTRRRY